MPVLKKDDNGEVGPQGRGDAVLRTGATGWSVSRLAPSEDLASVVDYHWIVRWDVTSPVRQAVIPQPVVHVAAERIDGDARVWVHGVNRARFVRELRGSGHVVASCLRPGGLRPFLTGPVSAVAGRVVPAGDLWATDDATTAQTLLASTAGDAVLVQGWEQWLREATPVPDPRVDEIAAWMAQAEHRTDVVRAEQLAEFAGVGLRTLQRRFDEYVGVGPKWAVRRFRLLDAAAAAHAGAPVDWAELAQRLGFSDQAHLIRAFTEVVGVSPAAYRRQASLG